MIGKRLEMDARVCKACSDILQSHSIQNDAGEPTFNRIYRVSQRALEASECPVCQRFLQYVQDIRPQREKLFDSEDDLDDVEITLNDSSIGGNFLSLKSKDVKQGPNHYFELYAEEGTRAASFTRRRPRLFDMGSPGSFDVIKSWIETCDEQHKCLPAPNFYPFRLLNLSVFLDGDIRLEHMQQPVKYAALSYCWGNSPADTQVKTLKRNVETHCLRIALSSLPQTIKDAIIVARGLGISYLWIDALCIIQDDDEDVFEEMITMANIYSSAWLTISASAARGCGDGFLDQHPELRKDPFVNVLYRFRDQEVCEAKLSNLYGDVSKQPLIWPCEEYVHRRGWTFQETLMSPRVIFFSAVQPYFMCREEWKCHGDPEPKFYFVEFDMHLIMDYLREGKAPWHEIVGSYSGRKLGVPIDKVRAIHCMRSWFHKIFGGVYWAGLWKSTLEVDLLWSPGRKHNRDTYELGTFSEYSENQVKLYPSWSWLRFDGQTRYSGNFRENGLICGSVKSEILEIVEEPEVDEFGHVREGTYLGLRCQTKTVLVPKWRFKKPRKINRNIRNEVEAVDADLSTLEIDDAHFVPYQVKCYDASIWDTNAKRYTVKPVKYDRKLHIGRLTFDHYSSADAYGVFDSEEDWEAEPTFVEILIAATDEDKSIGAEKTAYGIALRAEAAAGDDMHSRMGVFLGENGRAWYFENADERSYRLI